MGTFIDDLDDHEGYADRRLPNGQLTGGVWTYATREFDRLRGRLRVRLAGHR